MIWSSGRAGASTRRKTAITLLITLSLCAGLLCAPAFAIDTAKDSGLLVLVNKTYTLPADFVPRQQKLYGSVPVAASALTLRPEAAEAYIRMYAAMRADGVKTCNAQSGYRAYSTQRYLVNKRVQERMALGQSWETAYANTTLFTAPAGASEHQTGLALDLSTNGKLTAAFADTAAGKWLAEHAWEYGFILRYEGEKREYTMIADEAWHYRYVGVPHAKLVTENGFCYEEYIEYLHQTGYASVEVDSAVYDIYWTDDPTREYPGRNILDVSSDNAGGWIVTCLRPAAPLTNLQGHWSESYFHALLEQNAAFERVVDPDAPITLQELARLCGLEGGAYLPATREGAAALLAPWLPDQGEDVRPAYSDADQISPEALPGVKAAIANGLFGNMAGRPFQPAAGITWGEAATLAVRFREIVPPAAAAEPAPSDVPTGP